MWGGEGLHGQMPAPGRLTLNSGLCYGPSGVSRVEPATARAAASSTLHQPLLAPLQHPAHQCQPWTAAPIRQTPASGWKTTWHRHDLSQSQGCSALGSKKGVHPTATVQTLTPPYKLRVQWLSRALHWLQKAGLHPEKQVCHILMEQGFATQLPLKTQQGKTPSQRQNHPWCYPNLPVQAPAPFTSLANLCGEGVHSPNFRSTI